MGQIPLLVAETIGWYQWRQRIKRIIGEYHLRVSIHLYNKYNFRDLTGYAFYDDYAVRNIWNNRLQGFIPKKYYQNQEKFDRMILDAAYQRKYEYNE